MLNIIKNINKEKVKGGLVFPIILALCYLYGDVKVKSIQLNIFIILKYFIISAIYFFSIKVICYIIKSKIDIKLPVDLFGNYWIIFGIIFVCWIPHIVLKYPIAFWYDEYAAVLQGLGEKQLSGHFPLFYTYELTFFYNLFSNHNFGMFLFSLSHAIIMSLIYAKVIKTLNEICGKKWMSILFLLFYSVCPYVAGSIGTTTKDVYYSGYIVLLILLLLNYYYDKQRFYRLTNILLLFVSAVLITLTRKNGIYVVFFSIVYLVITEIRNKSYKKSLLLFSVLLTCFLMNKIIISNPNVAKGNVVEALSIPVQQTARLVKYCPELITEEEKIIISKVMPYDKLGDLYDEDLSDPVKFSTYIYTFNEDVIEYLKVWFKQFFKAPLVYAEATFRQNIYLLYPGKNIYKYNVECNGGWIDNQDQSLGLVQSPLFLKNTLQPRYWGLLYGLHEWPILNIINNMSVFIILFLFTVLLIMNSKNKDKMIVLIPCIVSLLIIIASPTIRTHPRYAFPIIYSFPIWFGLLTINKANN